MTVLILCHSEEAQQADVGIRPFYDGRGFGPPRSSAPTEGLPKSQQRADVVIGPYGKKEKLPRPPRQRLAKRKARKEELVKFRFYPTTELCSTAYNVRKSQQGPARALVEAASIEQDRLEPRPVVQEDAERPGCTTRTRFFF